MQAELLLVTAAGGMTRTSLDILSAFAPCFLWHLFTFMQISMAIN
jgi:hypothetical protein